MTMLRTFKPSTYDAYKNELEEISKQFKDALKMHASDSEMVSFYNDENVFLYVIPKTRVENKLKDIGKMLGALSKMNRDESISSEEYHLLTNHFIYNQVISGYQNVECEKESKNKAVNSFTPCRFL